MINERAVHVVLCESVSLSFLNDNVGRIRL